MCDDEYVERLVEIIHRTGRLEMFDCVADSYDNGNELPVVERRDQSGTERLRKLWVTLNNRRNAH